MRTLVCTEAGNLECIVVKDAAIPEPGDHEVQIAVRAAALSASDFSVFTEKAEKGKVSFLSKLLTENKPFGGDISGIISKTGKKISSLKAGDEVYASIGVNGGCADYITVKADKVFLKPANFSFEEAAAVPTSGLIALEACQKANIRTGSSVLVYGASGGVGQFAVQIAKALGGTVTAVCSSRNIENMYVLGADDVIDYTRTDISGLSRRFDAILGVNGDRTLKIYKNLLQKNGTYVAIGGKSAAGGLAGPLYALGSGKYMTFVFYASAVNHRHLVTLKEMAEAGKIKPYIEKTFLPQDAKTEFKRLCKDHAKGKNVIYFGSII